MISIAYVTSRLRPNFHWFQDGLRKQLKKHPVQVQVILVDYWKGKRHIVSGAEQIDFNIDGVEFTHVSPLPSPFQKHPAPRYEKNYFANATAHNTAFIHAIHPYVMFADDLCVISDRWLEGVIEAAKTGYVVMGSYRKDSGMQVENGSIVSSITHDSGLDSRTYLCPPDQKELASGSQLFGCCYGLPLEKALSINGLDCMTDVTGYEDCVFGVRLQRSGCPMYYDRRIMNIESIEGHSGDIVLKRVDPEGSMENYYRALSYFGVEPKKFKAISRFDASHVIVEVAYSHPSANAHWNFFDLRTLRAKHHRGEQITLSDMNYPERWWFDDLPISEM